LAPSLGVQQWDRHALFLDRKNVVLFDVVKASQPRSWSWLAHFTGNSWQEGSWIHGQGQNGQSLGVAVVAPAGTATSFSSTSPVKATNFDGSGSFTGAEVKSQPTAQAEFLTALVPVPEASWGSRASVDPADAAHPEAGLVLQDGDRRSVAVFAADGGATSAGGVTLAGLAGVATTKGGAMDRAVLVRGSSLTKDGKEILRVDGGTDLLEADGISSDTVWLSGGELKTARVWAPNATKVRWYGQDVPFQRDGEAVSVRLVQALAGSTAAGDGATTTASAPAKAAGGGCGAAGPGDLAAIMAALVALFIIGRARRRKPAPAPVTKLPPRGDDDEEPPYRKHG
jgi:uncharacterized protein (TIGR03382 family)